MHLLSKKQHNYALFHETLQYIVSLFVRDKFTFNITVDYYDDQIRHIIKEHYLNSRLSRQMPLESSRLTQKRKP
jgi:hypothetical protein